MRRLLGAVALVAFWSAGAAAQDARLSRLDPATRASVQATVDSARREHLPTEPLIQKAFEGLEKRAPGARITIAVRALRADLLRARAALGRNSRPAELRAGAMAIRAGAAPADLTRLRRDASARDLTVPLTVVSDLATRGVPATDAMHAVHDLVSARLTDDELAIFQRDIRTDVEHGAMARTAALTRARGLVERQNARKSRG